MYTLPHFTPRVLSQASLKQAMNESSYCVAVDLSHDGFELFPAFGVPALLASHWR